MAQLLPIPRLPDICPLRNPRSPALHLKFSELHLVPRLRRSRRRSNPPTSADSKQLQCEILQRLQILRHRQLACRRCHEDELLLPELGRHTLAFSPLRHISSLL